MSLPTNAQDRKDTPIATGVLDYFPDALAAVARCSKKGNDQHNPGEPLHWAREKSTDESDALIRHFLERGEVDVDGIPHSAKVAWRALALLQKEMEAAQEVEEGGYIITKEGLDALREKQWELTKEAYEKEYHEQA